MKKQRKVHMPSLQKIQEEADKISSTWSDREKEKRMLGITNRQLEARGHWTPPIIDMRETFDGFGINIWEV